MLATWFNMTILVFGCLPSHSSHAVGDISIAELIGK